MFGRRKTNPFFISLLTIAQLVQQAVHDTNNFHATSVADLKELSMQIKKYELEGDGLLHDLISKLNTAFFTPIDKEQILQLAIQLEDILDGIENFTIYLEMYSIYEYDEYIQMFLNYLVKCTNEMVGAIGLLSQKKFTQMRDHALQIKEYERNCDAVLRTSIKQLFIREVDPIHLIKLKDLYELLEEIVDDCHEVANIIETIIMRNR